MFYNSAALTHRILRNVIFQTNESYNYHPEFDYF